MEQNLTCWQSAGIVESLLSRPRHGARAIHVPSPKALTRVGNPRREVLEIVEMRLES